MNFALNASRFGVNKLKGNESSPQYNVSDILRYVDNKFQNHPLNSLTPLQRVKIGVASDNMFLSELAEQLNMHPEKLREFLKVSGQLVRPTLPGYNLHLLNQGGATRKRGPRVSRGRSRKPSARFFS